MQKAGCSASRSERPGPALATVTAAHGGLRIAAASPTAQQGGVVPGLPLADARALLPSLQTFEADPAADLRALDALAGWCGRYTPWTAADPDGGTVGAAGLWLDISGCAHLFGGEEALLGDLVRRLSRQGFVARAAVAATPGAAWAVARFAAPGREGVAVVPEGGVIEALAPLPVAALRLDAAAVEGLDRVGLRRVGDLIPLPRAPLAARYGTAVLKRLDQALGRSGESLSPRVPVPPLLARMAFAEPIGRAEDIAAAVRRLLDDLCVQMDAAGKGARRLELTLFRTDGSRTGTAIGTSRPARDPAHLETLFREKLDGLDPGFGVEVMVLAVPAADALGPVQDGLDGRGAAERAEGLARLVDRVGNRLGADRVSRFADRASHIPERACREIPALSPAPAVPAEALAEGPHRPARPRPVHLLPWPEPIEVMAPVPDHPPVMFRWHRRQHRVVRAEGPERIGPEWWREERPLDAAAGEQATRDYYRVEDADGRRFWLYREGLYKPGLAPRWYLHGVFA